MSYFLFAAATHYQHAALVKGMMHLLDVAAINIPMYSFLCPHSVTLLMTIPVAQKCCSKLSTSSKAATAHLCHPLKSVSGNSGYCTVTHIILKTCSVLQAYARGVLNQKIGHPQDSASGRGPAAAVTPLRSAPGGAGGDASANSTASARSVGTPLHPRYHLQFCVIICHCSRDDI